MRLKNKEFQFLRIIMDYGKRIIIVLAHLDDEFAIAPLIKKLTKFNTNIKVLYCAERRNSSERRQLKRRIESKISLNYLGIKDKNIIFMNDKYYLDDLKIHLSQKLVLKFLSEIYSLYKFEMIYSLNLEGGHPDHDSLSLIINRFSKINKLKTKYFSAYNYQKTLYFLPYSVLRPLRTQERFFKKHFLHNFCWFDSLKVALIYKSEWPAFVKILPFILFKLFFSNLILYAEKIEIDKIDWDKSLTCKLYKVNPELLFNI